MEVKQTPDEPTGNIQDSQSEIDKLMSMYNVPAKTIKSEVDNVPVSEPSSSQPLSVNVDTQTVPQPVTSGDPEAPFGRYQRGKLKGQPRTAPYTPVRNGQPITQIQQPVKPAEPPKLTGMLISGALFLMLINLCLPLGFSVLNNMFSKDKLNPEHLKLTKEQIKELDPVCDAAMKQASVTGNPVLLLILGICTAMGMNYVGWKMSMDAKKPKLPNP